MSNPSQIPHAFQRILVPLDGSELAERILTFVQWIIARRDVEVMLLGVLYDGEWTAGAEGSVSAACRYLDLQRRLLSVAGARVRYELMAGDPVERILGFALEYEPSLIAMSTHGRKGIARWVHGSVTENVLRGSRFPILTANPSALELDRKPHDLRFRNILVPLDGSERSAEILPAVAQIAKLYGSLVTLLNVIEPLPIGPVPGAMVETELDIASQGHAEELLEPHRLVLQAQGVSVRQLTVLGTAARSILRVATAEQADLIAMTTHGRSGLLRLVYGSVAEEVLRLATCPMLIKRSARVLVEEEAKDPAPAVNL